MARTKRNSLVNQTIPASLKQGLFKIKWKKLPQGGELREYELETSGVNLVRLASIDEVKPSTTYYVVDPIKPNVFYETSFHPEVSWDTILEFVSTKKIFIKNEPAKTASVPNTSKPSPILSLWDS
jgi:hypothetical protein